MTWIISEKAQEKISSRIIGVRPHSTAKKFDDYYLMLILGLADGTQKQKIPTDEEEVFLQSKVPPQSYLAQWPQLQSLVIDAYLTEEGTDRTKKENVNAVVQQLISDVQESPLQDEFWNAINGYARRGAQRLNDLPEESKSWEGFMETYQALVNALYSNAKSGTNDAFEEYQELFFEIDD